jgi:hypothetical protein
MSLIHFSSIQFWLNISSQHFGMIMVGCVLLDLDLNWVGNWWMKGAQKEPLVLCPFLWAMDANKFNCNLRPPIAHLTGKGYSPPIPHKFTPKVAGMKTLKG